MAEPEEEEQWEPGSGKSRPDLEAAIKVKSGFSVGNDRKLWECPRQKKKYMSFTTRFCSSCGHPRTVDHEGKKIKFSVLRACDNPLCASMLPLQDDTCGNCGSLSLSLSVVVSSCIASQAVYVLLVLRTTLILLINMQTQGDAEHFCVWLFLCFANLFAVYVLLVILTALILLINMQTQGVEDHFAISVRCTCYWSSSPP